MPIYEYQCQACQHEFETIQKFSDAPLTRCPECGKHKLKKKISAVAFRLKGGGWYETDFKSGDKKKNVASSDAGDSSDSSSTSESSPKSESSAKADGKASDGTAAAKSTSDGSSKSSSGEAKSSAKKSAKKPSKSTPQGTKRDTKGGGGKKR